jgi:hypothetical protein
MERYGAVTQAGPFKGMACIRDAREGCLVPKLLGCYEEEIVPAMESFFRRGYERFIDVGCASGYWLVGAAVRMPGAECFGFDGDEDALTRCRELLELNGVASRVTLSGLCSREDLQRLVTPRTLLFMDCDGPEYDLLDPETSPALRGADILVECHDYLDARITPSLLSRFGDSHEIERISSRLREPSLERYPGLDALPREHWTEALHERRPAPQDWLVMRVRR